MFDIMIVRFCSFFLVKVFLESNTGRPDYIWNLRHEDKDVVGIRLVFNCFPVSQYGLISSQID